jgi:hypothetical protein
MKEQGHENRLRQPPQPETCHGDAQLRRAQVGGQVLQDVPGQPGAAIAGHNQPVQLRVPQLDEGELRRDKKSVGQYNGQQSAQAQRSRG